MLLSRHIEAVTVGACTVIAGSSYLSLPLHVCPAENELSAFYHTEDQRAQLEAAFRRSGPVDKSAVQQQRLLQYREAVTAGYTKQQQLAGTSKASADPNTVLAKIEMHAIPLPAAVLGRGYNHSVDWWTLGVLMYVLLTARQPFSSPKTHDPMEVRRWGVQY